MLADTPEPALTPALFAPARDLGAGQMDPAADFDPRQPHPGLQTLLRNRRPETALVVTVGVRRQPDTAVQ